MADSEIVPAERESRLTPREEGAYLVYSRLGQPKLSPTVVAQLFEMYLLGKSCDEIVRNCKGFSLGQVVQARVENNWDEKRDEYVASLLDNVRSRVQQAQIRAINTTADTMDVIHSLMETRLATYLRTRDEADLGELKHMGLKQLREASELLLKLTGQDNNKKVTVDAHHTITAQPAFAASRAPTATEAALVIETARKNKKK